MTRQLVAAAVLVDQSSYPGASNVGFGTFTDVSQPRYRGQVFTPTKTTLAAIAFYLNAAPGTADMDVYLTDVDQTTLLPIGSPLASWTIPNAQLVNGQLVTYALAPAYTGLLTIGHKYAYYLGPSSGGTGNYLNQYRNMRMSNPSVYGGIQQLKNLSGTWSLENLSWIFATGYPAVRSIAQ